MDNKDSIEQHAIEHHRYHPVILRAAIELFKQQPDKVKGLFASARDLELFYNALRHAKVVILKRDRIASGRRAPANRKDPCIEHFCWYPANIPHYFKARLDFFEFVRFVLNIDIEMRTGALQSKDGDVVTQRQTGDTPCFMLADRPIWARGVLNKEGRHVGNTFDLATFEGFVFFMHEAFHVMQWYRSPLRLLFEYLKAVVKSLALSSGHIPWAHELIEFEVEAMVFHNKLWKLLDSWPEARDFLSRFGTRR
jgi:hypothetical protein